MYRKEVFIQMTFTEKYGCTFSKDLYDTEHHSQLLCREVLYRKVSNVSEVVGKIEPGTVNLKGHTIYKSSNCKKLNAPCVVSVVNGNAVVSLVFESNCKIADSVLVNMTQGEELIIPSECIFQIFSTQTDIELEYRIYYNSNLVTDFKNCINSSIIIPCTDGIVVNEKYQLIIGNKKRMCLAYESSNILRALRDVKFNVEAHEFITKMIEEMREFEWPQKIYTETF